MASGKDIKISITSALNAAGIEATKRQVDGMAKSVSAAMAGMASANKTHWADVKAAWDMGCAAITKAWQGVTAGLKSAFSFETTTVHFETLIGSIDEAKRHMQDLKELGDTPPFSLNEFAAASRQLMVMSDGALGYKRSLELIGDAAAATGISIEQMGHAVGRMYAFIRDGQPLSRAVMELRNMGVITPEVAQHLQDLQDAGASNAEIWEEVEKQLSRYQGAMANTEKTGEGLIGAIQTRWDNIVRVFGQAFEATAKGGLTKFLDKLKELEESGTLEVWAAKVAAACEKVVEAVKVAVGWGQKLVDAYKWVQDKVEVAGSYWGTAIGTLSAGGSLDDAAKAASDAAGQTQLEQVDRRTEEKVAEEKIRQAAKEKKAAEKQAEQEKRDADEKSRIQKQLNDAQKKKADRDERDDMQDVMKDKARGDLADANAQLAEARKNEAKASADVLTAEEKLKTAIDTYNANLRQNLVSEAIEESVAKDADTKSLQNTFADVISQLPAIANAAGEIAAQLAIENGEARTVADYDKIYNQTAREERIAGYKQAAKEATDEQRAKRIEEKSEKARSQADKDWLEKFKKIQEGNRKQKEDIEKAKQELADAKQREKDAQQAMIDASKDIDSIKLQLQQLGLK